MEKHTSLGIGIIGCGRIARMRHLPILKGLDGVHLAAAADSDPGALALVAGQYSIARLYSDHHALLEDPAVEAVLVSTPPRSHFVHARDVLLSGRHVCVDSPLALAAEECDQLVELAGRSHNVAAVGLNLRQHSSIDRARRDIEAGLLGPIQAIDAVFTTPSRGLRGDRFSAWRRPDTLDGSVFTECAVQHFDAWRVLTARDLSDVFVQCPRIGGPVSVAATMRAMGDAGEAPIAVAAVFSEYSGDHSEIRVIGRDGMLELSLYRYDGYRFCPALTTPGSVRQHLGHVAQSVRSLPLGLRNRVQGGEYGLTFRRMLRAFRDACSNGQQVPASFADGRAATVAVLAAFQSMTTGQRVSIPRATGSS